MAIPSDLPIVDHHCHLSPDGEGVAAARRFRQAGGTHLFLATQNYDLVVPRTLEDYRRQFATTVELARSIEASVEIRCYPVLAPYPVDLLDQVERLGPAGAVELQSRALEVAGQLVEEQRAVALGEVGRPHFPVAEPITESIDAVLRRAMEIGRDVGCPVVIHSADLDAGGFHELAAFAARASFPLQRLVKHYQRTRLPAAEYLGVTPSYLARRELVAGSLQGGEGCFLETDFLDDPRRPGAVLDLATIPHRAAAAIGRDPAAVERLRVPFQRTVQAVYGFTPEVGPQGAR
ncbi:MAG TPA: TatD family hydrolase [Thermoplasmata archaeon]|nr:TatD family hydrolase [Thermoplasmata archaeon]